MGFFKKLVIRMFNIRIEDLLNTPSLDNPKRDIEQIIKEQVKSQVKEQVSLSLKHTILPEIQKNINQQILESKKPESTKKEPIICSAPHLLDKS